MPTLNHYDETHNRDEITHKVCKICLRPLPVSEFYHHPTTWDRLLPECKECKRKIVHNRRSDDVEKAKRMEREQYRKRQDKKWNRK